MQQNLGTAHRWIRALAAVAMGALAVAGPFPVIPRVLGFGTLGLYMLATAFTGHCAGLRLMGRSACPR